MEDREYVIVRSADAGVFAGYLDEKNGNEVILSDARRIWRWTGAASLSQLSQEGTTNPAACKFPIKVPKITVLGVCEIICCSISAQTSIENVPIWRV